MISQLIQTLYRYNEWANGRILETTAQLNAEEFLASRGASYDSVRDTLVHTMSGQWLYLERWHGRSPDAALNAGQFPDLASIVTRWAEVERGTQAICRRGERCSTRPGR